MHIKSEFLNDDAVLKFAQYVDGTTAVTLFDAEFGEPLATATVCLVDMGERPSEGNVFIKSYSENEGLYEALLAAGVIGEKVNTVNLGFVEVYECPLLVEP